MTGQLWSTGGPPPLRTPGGILWRGSSKLVSPIGLSDSLAYRWDAARSVTEPVGITGVQTFTQGFSRSATDSVGITDSATTALITSPTFDNGAGNAGHTTSLSVTFDVDPAANALLVWSSVVVAQGTSSACNINGTTVPQLQSLNFSGTNDWMPVYGLRNPPTGLARTVTVTASAASSMAIFAASYFHVSTIGTSITKTGSGTAASHAVAAPSGLLIVQGFSNSLTTAGAFSAYNQTQRFNQASVASTNPALVVGEASWASSVTFNATQPSATYGSVAIPLT